MSNDKLIPCLSISLVVEVIVDPPAMFPEDSGAWSGVVPRYRVLTPPCPVPEKCPIVLFVSQR